jgi:hypothetical protein
MAAFTTLPEASRPIETELEPIRYALLGDILPGTATGIEPARLADFKADHHDLLVSFRNRVEHKAIECAQVADGRLRDAMLGRVRGELANDLNEIERRMVERRWPLAARCALGVAVAALGLADLAVSGGNNVRPDRQLARPGWVGGRRVPRTASA